MQNDYQNSENNDEDDLDRRNTPVRRTPLGLEQKIAVVILFIFAIAVMGMWSVQFKKSITNPFNYQSNNTADNTKNSSAAASQQQAKDSEEALRSKDTDGDGLSDWDELYIYKTSPYLEDSDSDGFSDKEEIDSGNDPNCPVGRNCYSSNIIKKNSSETDNTNSLNLQSNQNNNLLNGTNGLNSQSGQNNNLLNGLITPPTSDNNSGKTNSADLKSIIGDKLDAPTLRQMLLKAGMSEKILNQISDDDLIKSYQEILNKQQ